jgi:hypothetical protein
VYEVAKEMIGLSDTTGQKSEEMQAPQSRLMLYRFFQSAKELRVN